MEKLIVTSFYKYVSLSNLENFQKEHLDFCNEIGIKGKVLIGTEGINASISGNKEQIKEYKKKLKTYKEFSDIKFKDTESTYHPFRKTIVRIRKEIVTSNFNVDPTKTGHHLSPKELKNMYDKKEDFVIIDARNNYESKIGKFKNAITPKIETFREFTKVIAKLNKYKNKKIVMYCTGGVRCEKASALLIKKGFKDVNQIDGGILNYIEQYPDTYFEGRCFVFDDRLSIPSGKSNNEITLCEKCHIPCGKYSNCMNAKCNKLVIHCDECKIQYKDACSKKCRNLTSN